MTIERFGTRLDDYLSGELDATERREIEEALAASPAARAELEVYRSMVDALGELPDEIEPERDLFPAIEERIDAPTATAPGRRRLALAAALLAALGIGYLTAPWRGGTRQAVEGPVTGTTALASQPISTPTTAAERDLLAATEELRRTLDEHREALPPETLELVESNLAIIQGAIAEIQRAIDRDPSNPELNRALVAYYQHELALLEQVGRAAARL